MESDDPIASLFYTLLRDGDVSPGRLELLVQEQEDHVRKGNETTVFTNGFLAQYAHELAKRFQHGLH